MILEPYLQPLWGLFYYKFLLFLSLISCYNIFSFNLPLF